LARQIKTLERELDAIRRDIAANLRQEDDWTTELANKINDLQQEETALTQRWEQEREAVTAVLELRQRLAQAQAEDKHFKG